MPYEEDLYLDVVVNYVGEIILLDENELKEAFNRFEVNKTDYYMAYTEANNLIKRLENNKDKLERLTNKYLEIMIGDEK